eukprot:3896379-Pyramimonas_sp.AAC.1
MNSSADSGDAGEAHQMPSPGPLARAQLFAVGVVDRELPVLGLAVVGGHVLVPAAEPGQLVVLLPVVDDLLEDALAEVGVEVDLAEL